MNDFSHMLLLSPRCGRWKACLGGGRLQRIGIHFWNGNTIQMSLIDLARTLQKLLAAFHTFQRQFSPDGNRNQCTHAAALSPPSWNVTHTVEDIHSRTSTEQMRGDTDLWFCTYTCTELPCVSLCCHFATYYNFPEKKSVPELNDQPTYVWATLLAWHTPWWHLTSFCFWDKVTFHDSWSVHLWIGTLTVIGETKVHVTCGERKCQIEHVMCLNAWYSDQRLLHLERTVIEAL